MRAIRDLGIANGDSDNFSIILFDSVKFGGVIFSGMSGIGITDRYRWYCTTAMRAIRDLGIANGDSDNFPIILFDSVKFGGGLFSGM